MFSVNLFSIKKPLVRLRLSTVVGGMLAAWLAAYAVAASAKDASVAPAGDQQRDLLPKPEKSWFSHTHVPSACIQRLPIVFVINSLQQHRVPTFIR